MVKNSGGTLSGKTRARIRRRRVTVRDRVKSYKIGSKVVVLDNTVREGAVPPRYKGRHATIMKKQGEAYVVQVKDGRALKTLILSPENLREAA